MNASMNLTSGITFFVSLLIVGFAQPSFSNASCVIASMFGYALFFKLLLSMPEAFHRFRLAVFWFSLVQLIQFSWAISHPFLYMYALYPFVCFCLGLQFGVIGIFIQPAQFQSFNRLAGISGLWVLLEWSRLFILSGVTWNPVGMSLTSNVVSLQWASFWGVYGLSFWVIFTNLSALKAWIEYPKKLPAMIWCAAAAAPFLYGAIHLDIHRHIAEDQKHLHALLAQPAFPIEETLELKGHHQMIPFVLQEWKQILTILKPHLGKSIDLIALPEFTVPYGTYSFVFPYAQAVSIFQEIFGIPSLAKLPPLEHPFAVKLEASDEGPWVVNNAFWSQAIANLFNAELVIGLEDAEDLPHGERVYYSAALYYQPGVRSSEDFQPVRYEKQVLVPFGEYIPSRIFKTLAQAYGIGGSFTPGKESKIVGQKCPIGITICYEETFGDLTRQNKHKGAEILLNLTSDVWYPNSRLPRVHFDHARLRTVENGTPLLRACNTGITAGVDSLGRIVASLSDPIEEGEWTSAALYVKMPVYNYKTLYSIVGDKLIIALSLLFSVCFLRYRNG